MNLLKTIIFIGLTMMLVNCGNSQNNNKGANTVRVAAVEDGVPKTEDGRIILSSQSSEDNSLVMPEGTCENCVVSSQKLGEEIASQLKSVSEVYNISFSSELYVAEVLHDIFSFGMADAGYNYFSVSFTIKTVTSKIHNNIKCQAKTDTTYLRLRDCGNDQVTLKLISVNFNKIVIDDSNSPRSLIN